MGIRLLCLMERGRGESKKVMCVCFREEYLVCVLVLLFGFDGVYFFRGVYFVFVFLNGI